LLLVWLGSGKMPMVRMGWRSAGSRGGNWPLADGSANRGLGAAVYRAADPMASEDFVIWL